MKHERFYAHDGDRVIVDQYKLGQYRIEIHYPEYV